LLTFAGNAEVRDPTMPGNLPATTLLESPSGEMALTVSAIRIGGSSRHAIINGANVKAGQQLDDDIRILKIMPRYVVVKYHGVNKKLYLVPPIKSQ
jgi:hypothetical protein